MYCFSSSRMTSALCWCFGSFLLIDLVMMTSSTETQNAATEIFRENVIIPPRPEGSIHQRHHHRRKRDPKERIRSGQLRETHIVFHTQNERPELESLGPVRLEMDTGDKRWVRTARTFLGLDSRIPDEMNISQGAGISEKPTRHPAGHKVFGGHVIMDRNKGKR